MRVRREGVPVICVIWGINNHSCQIGPEIKYKGSECNDSPTPLFDFDYMVLSVRFFFKFVLCS